MALNVGQSTPVSKQNEIMDNLVEPLALQAIHEVPSTNPLFEVFERETVEAGAEIEEIVMCDANIEAYDETGATTLTPRDVKAVARYYNDYEHKVYTTTVYDREIAKVALRPENATRLASVIVNQLTQTRDDDVYQMEKKVLSDMASTYPYLQAGEVDSGTSEAQGEQLTIMVRDLIDALQFKNELYIPWNHNHPNKKIKGKAFLDRIRIIIPYQIKNRLNVGYLANVYNLDKTDLLSKIVTIDSTDGIVYVIDKMSVFRYPQTDHLKRQENAEGDFRTEFLHVNAMLGASTLFKFAFVDASAMLPSDDEEVVEG